MKIPSLLAAAFLALIGLRADTVVLWNFNNTNNQALPSSGMGSLVPIGGITVSAPSTGSGSSDTNASNFALQTTGYPTTPEGDRKAGIEVAASTVGFANIRLAFDYRGSSTSSRRLAVLYSTDGTTFTEGAVVGIAVAGVFTNRITLDLSSVAAAHNNPQFKFRVVSTLDGGAFAAISGTYSANGTARFDMVTVTGDPSVSKPPFLSVPPVGQTFYIGSNASLSASAGGTEPLSFEWQREAANGSWTPIPGATSATLSLVNIQAADAGRYRVVVRNPLGFVTSDPAVVVVQEDPSNRVVTLASLRAAQDPAQGTPLDTTSLFTVEGVVTTHANLTSGTANYLFYIQDETAGMAVFWSGAQSAGKALPAAGTRVRIKSPVTHFRGLLEMAPADSNPAHAVMVFATNQALPPPVPLPFSTDPNVLEALEGSLVVARDVVIDPVATSGVFTSISAGIAMTDPLGQAFPLYANAGTDLIGKVIPVGTSTVIGVLGQFDASAPFTSGYQFIPSRFADIVSAFKAPSIRFTNVLSRLVRPGDALTNSFPDHGLRPGETITIRFDVTDPEGRVVTVTPGQAIPAGGRWNFPSLSGTNLSGTYTFDASANDAGKAHDVELRADNGSASFTQRVRIYVPTPAEQRVVITEYFANPASTNALPWFNLLNRVEPLPGAPDASPSNRDEFIEVVNLSPEPIDMTGWMVSDSLLRRAYLYPGSAANLVAPSNAIVIYGGPSFGYAPQLPVPALAAEVGPGDPFSTAGLALNDAGDAIVLRNAQSNVVARVVYSQAQTSTNGSMVRFPTDADGFVPSRSVSETHGSPGLQPSGVAWTEPQPSTDQAPVILTAPAPVTVPAGAPAVFTVVASGIPAPSFQWQRNNNDLPGETSDALALANTTSADDGALFRVVASNRAGSVTSAPVLLRITVPPPEILRTNLAHVRSTVDPVNLRPTDPTQLFEVEAIVTTHVNLTTSGNTLFYAQDATAGIAVYVAGKPGSEVPPAGARVRIVGPVSHFNGLLQINLSATNPRHVVEVLATGVVLPDAIPLDLAWPAGTSGITAASPGVLAAEAAEGRRVRASNVLVDTGSGPVFTSGSNVILADAADPARTFVLRIDSRVLEVIGQPKPAGPVSIEGVLGQFDSADPRAGGYQLVVTRWADILPASAPVAVPATASLGDERIDLTWTTPFGATCSVWSAPSLLAPFEKIASGITGGRHSEPIPADSTERYFKVTSP
ncbi:MAG: immunoglobulin domain-containing protein [Verrucomicrobiota bacterium]|jgi:hypothetical protein